MSKKLLIGIIGGIAAVGIAVTAFFLLSNSSKILKMIPAESELVMTFNVNELIESTGCEISGEEVILTPEIEELTKDLFGKGDKKEFNEFLEALAESNNCFDLDQIAFVANDTDDWEEYALVAVKNRENAIKFFEDQHKDANFEKEGNYDVAKLYSTKYIVIDDDYCWVYSSNFDIENWEDYEKLDESDAVEAIEDLKKKANEKSISDVSYKKDVLNGDAVFAMLYDSKNSQFNDDMSRIFGKYWEDTYNEVKVGVEVILDDAVAEMKVQLYNKEGDKIEKHPMLQNINSDFAKYITPDDYFAGAIAMDTQFIKDLIEETGENIDDDAEEVLSSLKGTMSVAFGIKDFNKIKAGDPSGITFLAMAEMSKNDADELIQNLADEANGREMSYNGSTIECNVNGFTFEIGSKDGYIYIANRPLKEKGNEQIPASFFEEKQFAAKSLFSKDQDFAKLIELTEDVTAEMVLNEDGCLSYKVDFGDIGDAKGLPDFYIKKAYELYSNKSKRRELEEWFENTFSGASSYDDYGYSDYSYDDYVYGDTVAYDYSPAFADSVAAPYDYYY